MSDDERDTCRKTAAADRVEPQPVSVGEGDTGTSQMQSTQAVEEHDREDRPEGGRSSTPVEDGGTRSVEPEKKNVSERKVESVESDNQVEDGREGDEGRTDEVLEGEREGGRVSPDQKGERKVYKSQLLKSAGIQLQGSKSGSNEAALGEELAGVPRSSQDRKLEQFSEILLDSDHSDLSPTDSETQMTLPAEDGANEVTPSGPAEEEGDGGRSKLDRRVRFADELESTDAASTDSRAISSRPGSLPTGSLPTEPDNEGASPKHPGTPVSPSLSSPRLQAPRSPSAPHTHDEIIAGVGYSAEYLGSTPIMLTGNASAKSARMQQAQQVVKLFKDPENDILPRFPVTVRISSQCIKIVDSTAGIDLMDHPLYTISYVADIENVLVIMINRITPPSPADPSQGEEGIGVKGRESVEARVEGKGEEEVGECGKEGGGGGVERTERDKDVGQDSVGEEVEEGDNGMHVGPIPRMICHVLETKDEFLRKEVKPKNKSELTDGILQFWHTVSATKCQKYISHLNKVIPEINRLQGEATGF